MFQNYIESGPTLLGNTAHKLRASFRLSQSNTTIANTLRRQILVGTPTVAFRTEPVEKSEVIIQVNTTPLMNEMIAHRIGMIPIRADPSTFDPTRYEFHINKENNTKQMMDICASDFTVIEKNPEDPLDEGRVVPTENFFPPDPITGDTTLITRLRPQWNPSSPNERLVVKGRASISTGKENIRWSSVSQCSFENTRDEDTERQERMFREWLDKSKKVKLPDPTSAEGPSVSEDRIAELRREYNTMEIQRCFLVNEQGEPFDFTFYLESIGIHSLPECVVGGIQSIIDQLTKYQDMDGTLPDNVILHHGDARFPCVDVTFRDEDHTLGNLLQHYLIIHHVDGTEEPRLTYAGYKVPHPLKAEMLLRVGVTPDIADPELELQTVRLAIAKVIRGVKGVFQAMLENWTRLHTPVVESSQPV